MSRLLAVLLPLFLATSAFANLNLPEPEALLVKAHKSRTDLRNAIMEIDLNIPELRDPATFDKYFNLLDKLNDYANEYKLETYYPDSVRNLALHMVDNGMRWLDVTKDPRARVLYYAKWMNSDVLERFLGQVAYQLEDLKDANQLKTASDNIEALLPLAEKIAGANSYSLIGFRRLVSVTAVTMLKNADLALTDKIFWINKVQIPSEFAAYIEILLNRIYSLTADNKANSHQYLELLETILNRAMSSPTSAAASQLNSLQDGIIESLIRMVNFEEPIADLEFKKAIACLNPKQTQSLIEQWMSIKKNPTTNYIYAYLHLSGILINKATAEGLDKDASELLKWLGSSSAPAVVRIQDMEGHYELTDQAGEKWLFTLVIARENMVVASLSTADRRLERALYSITVDYDTMALIASDRANDSEREPNFPLRIQLEADGKLSIQNKFAAEPSQRVMVGQKIASFPDGFQFTSVTQGPPEHVYEGAIYFPKGVGKKMRLSISTLDGYLVGKLQDLENPLFFVDLSIGSVGKNGVVYLLSGRQSGSTMLQLRGVVVGDDLQIYTVVGGRGISSQMSTLHSVSN
jgi:hypothetical protein